MPIQFNGKMIPSIKYDDSPIGRVFQDQKLVWGMFNCYFKMVSSAGNIQQNNVSGVVKNDTNNEDTFVGGIGVSKLNPPTTPNGVTFIKGCSDKSCNNTVTSIDKDKKEDITLYGKCYIQGTQYKVTYEWYE